MSSQGSAQNSNFSSLFQGIKQPLSIRDGSKRDKNKSPRIIQLEEELERMQYEHDARLAQIWQWDCSERDRQREIDRAEDDFERQRERVVKRMEEAGGPKRKFKKVNLRTDHEDFPTIAPGTDLETCNRTFCTWRSSTCRRAGISFNVGLLEHIIGTSLEVAEGLAELDRRMRPPESMSYETSLGFEIYYNQ